MAPECHVVSGKSKFPRLDLWISLRMWLRSVGAGGSEGLWTLAWAHASLLVPSFWHISTAARVSHWTYYRSVLPVHISNAKVGISSSLNPELSCGMHCAFTQKMVHTSVSAVCHSKSHWKYQILFSMFYFKLAFKSMRGWIQEKIKI